MDTRHLDIEEPGRIPRLDLAFGYGAMAPLAAGALAVLLGYWPALPLVVLWGAAILIFLSGVRRGLSFRTERGPRVSQIVVMLWLFVAGLVALALPAVPALALLVAGFASLAVLDPFAALRGEVPPYFARLRPPQLAIAVVSLGAVLGRLLAA